MKYTVAVAITCCLNLSCSPKVWMKLAKKIMIFWYSFSPGTAPPGRSSFRIANKLELFQLFERINQDFPLTLGTTSPCRGVTLRCESLQIVLPLPQQVHSVQDPLRGVGALPKVASHLLYKFHLRVCHKIPESHSIYH